MFKPIYTNTQPLYINSKPFYVRSQTFDKKNSIILSKCSAIQGNLLHPMFCYCISMSTPSRPPSWLFDDIIFELLLCSLTCSCTVTCVTPTTSSTLSPFLSLITLKVRLRYVCNHPCILFTAALCGGYKGCRS
jgi:hypothetical protein